MSAAAASVLLRFAGIQVLSKAFDEILEAAFNTQQRGKWVVVSAVDYAEVLEWRTPHWRVAIQSIADEFELDTREQQAALNVMIAGGSISKDLATRLAKEVRNRIHGENLIDTGNYIGSIAIGPSIGQAFIQSESQLLDPSTSVLSE